MLKRSRQTSQRITPACDSALFFRGKTHVFEQLVADGVVGGERRGVGGGGLRAGRAAIGFDEQQRLLLGELPREAQEGGGVAEALEVGPGLLDGGLVRVVGENVLLVDVARVPERDELRDPAVLVPAGELVQDRRGDRPALGENPHRAEAGLGQSAGQRGRWGYKSSPTNSVSMLFGSYTPMQLGPRIRQLYLCANFTSSSYRIGAPTEPLLAFWRRLPF